MQRIEVTVLHHFTGGKDGCCVYAGLAKDRRGNFYGITYLRDHNHRDGVLFKLRNTNQGYRFQILHSYSPADGRFCVATPTPDKSGNILGVCEAGGENGDGTLWEYSSSGQFTVLHSFARDIDGTYPQDSVAIDQSGGIYGTTTYGGTGEIAWNSVGS